MKAALVGQGIGASLTPEMHAAEGRALGLAYSYGRFDTALSPWRERSLAQILAHAEAKGYAGLNITHPFKSEVPSLVDQCSSVVDRLGAANTVVFRDGRRFAFNTDHSGFHRAFEASAADLPRGHVLLIGAGGAGPAVAMALLDSKVGTLEVFDTSPGKAEQLIARMQPAYPDASMKAHTHLPSPDLLMALDGMVNATPVGMDSHPGVALDPRLLATSAWIADIVYFPRETELLRRANLRGMRILPGTGMALYQAVGAFELITGHVPDADRMAATLDAALGRTAPSTMEEAWQ